MSSRPLAVVTGASSGIGAAFARKLAREGHDLLLVARREDRLRELAVELDADGGTCTILACDLSDPAQRDHLCSDLRDRPRFSVLVHNAGFGVTGAVGVADARKLEDMAQVHVNTTIALTSVAARRFREAGHGRIVVVSSIAGWLFGAGSATYCATKSFQTSFTRSLARELEGFGVKVLALCPGYTRTEFHDTTEYADWNRGNVPAWMWSTPETVVEHAWRDLEKGKSVCVPGWVNKGVVFLMTSGIASLVRERLRRRGAESGR